MIKYGGIAESSACQEMALFWVRAERNCETSCFAKDDGHCVIFETIKFVKDSKPFLINVLD